jgi:hypothetical protein
MAPMAVHCGSFHGTVAASNGWRQLAVAGGNERALRAADRGSLQAPFTARSPLGARVAVRGHHVVCGHGLADHPVHEADNMSGQRVILASLEQEPTTRKDTTMAGSRCATRIFPQIRPDGRSKT